jgi:hypothetical protein
MEIYILTDIFRKLYTDLGYTWRQNNIMKQATYIAEQKTQWSKEKRTKRQTTIYKTFT